MMIALDTPDGPREIAFRPPTQAEILLFRASQAPLPDRPIMPAEPVAPVEPTAPAPVPDEPAPGAEPDPVADAARAAAVDEWSAWATAHAAWVSAHAVYVVAHAAYVQEACQYIALNGAWTAAQAGAVCAWIGRLISAEDHRWLTMDAPAHVPLIACMAVLSGREVPDEAVKKYGLRRLS